MLAVETLDEVVKPEDAPIGHSRILVPTPVTAVVFPVPAEFCVINIVKVVTEFLVAAKFLNETIPMFPPVGMVCVNTVPFCALHSRRNFPPPKEYVEATDTVSTAPFMSTPSLKVNESESFFHTNDLLVSP